jgi:hypothetical protein
LKSVPTHQPRRQTIVQVTAPDGDVDSEFITMVNPQSQSVGRAKELDDEMYGTKRPRPKAGLRYTPVNTNSRRCNDDNYSLHANGLADGVWGKLQPREVRAFAAVTCYNENGEELQLTEYARNVFMLQQVFGEKVREEIAILIIIDWEEMPILIIIDWEEMPILIIIDWEEMPILIIIDGLDFCHNELGVVSSEVDPRPAPYPVCPRALNPRAPNS